MYYQAAKKRKPVLDIWCYVEKLLTSTASLQESRLIVIS